MDYINVIIQSKNCYFQHDRTVYNMPNSQVRVITNDMLTYMIICLPTRKENVADMMYSYPRELK